MARQGNASAKQAQMHSRSATCMSAVLNCALGRMQAGDTCMTLQLDLGLPKVGG